MLLALLVQRPLLTFERLMLLLLIRRPLVPRQQHPVRLFEHPLVRMSGGDGQLAAHHRVESAPQVAASLERSLATAMLRHCSSAPRHCRPLMLARRLEGAPGSCSAAATAHRERRVRTRGRLPRRGQSARDGVPIFAVGTVVVHTFVQGRR